jgi:hypothetical protein
MSALSCPFLYASLAAVPTFQRRIHLGRSRSLMAGCSSNGFPGPFGPGLVFNVHILTVTIDHIETFYNINKPHMPTNRWQNHHFLCLGLTFERFLLVQSEGLNEHEPLEIYFDRKKHHVRIH